MSNNITEASKIDTLNYTLSSIVDEINNSYGNNTSAVLNSAGDTIIFGDITKDTPPHKLRIVTKHIPVYFVEGEIGDREEYFIELPLLKERLIELITNIMKAEYEQKGILEQQNWKQRTKSLLDNELFVDFE